MHQEMPSITASAYGSNTLDAAKLFMGVGRMDRPSGVVSNALEALNIGNNLYQPAAAQKEQSMSSTARIVKVFIADSNENLPLEKRVLYTGEEKLTDLTDQELFFDIPIVELLKSHNEYRKTVVDKKQAEKFGRDIYLEAARVRDLKMVVVNVAQF